MDRYLRLVCASLMFAGLMFAVSPAVAVTTTTADMQPPSIVFPIPPDSIGTVEVPFIVSGAEIMVQDVQLRLALAHTYLVEVTVRLRSPEGTEILLFSNRPGHGVFGDGWFQDTLFDDAAPDSINAGTSPFIGSFRPVDAFANFAGENPNGTWKLLVNDSQLDDSGIVYAAGDQSAPWSAVLGTQLVVNSEGGFPVTAIPEPLSAATLTAAAGMLALLATRRRSRQAQ